MESLDLPVPVKTDTRPAPLNDDATSSNKQALDSRPFERSGYRIPKDSFQCLAGLPFI